MIHYNAYRRLKHKTQVFFSPTSDHICTRIEHVVHVESISYTIAKYLGLNTELTKAIATAHDIGHSPFGHQGEKVLSDISERLRKTLEEVDLVAAEDTRHTGKLLEYLGISKPCISYFTHNRRGQTRPR